VRRAIHADRTCVDPQDTLAEAANLVELMANEDHGAASSGHVAHFAEAFLLKIDVTDSEDFIDEEYFRLEMGCDGESEADVHARGVVLDGRVNEFFELGEGDDFVEFLSDFSISHS